MKLNDDCIKATNNIDFVKECERFFGMNAKHSVIRSEATAVYLDIKHIKDLTSK